MVTLARFYLGCIVSTDKPIWLPQWGRLYSNRDVSFPVIPVIRSFLDEFHANATVLLVISANSICSSIDTPQCSDGWRAHNPRGTPTLMGRISKTRALLIDRDVATFQYARWNKVNKSDRRYIPPVCRGFFDAEVDFQRGTGCGSARFAIIRVRSLFIGKVGASPRNFERGISFGLTIRITRAETKISNFPRRVLSR